MTAPQPSSYALPMTFAFVPGGPEATTKGLGNFKPSTVMLRSDIVNLFAAKGVQTAGNFQGARFRGGRGHVAPASVFRPAPWCPLLKPCQGFSRGRPRRFVGFRVLIIPRIPRNYHCLSRDPAAALIPALPSRPAVATVR